MSKGSRYWFLSNKKKLDKNKTYLETNKISTEKYEVAWLSPRNSSKHKLEILISIITKYQPLNIQTLYC